MNAFVEEHRNESHKNEINEYDEYLETIKAFTNSKVYCDIIYSSHKYEFLFDPAALDQVKTAFTKLLYEEHLKSLELYGHLLIDKLVPKLNKHDKFTALIAEAAFRLINGGKYWRPVK
jgi:hypothetical protein